jgi:Ca2+-binding EF-hand superfamily protein
VMASLGEMTEDEIDDMMKAADSNNDGQVDYEEFKRVMMST